ncbi:LysR family transcriptional regulator [Cereibacter sphaeroides]|nr:LysR family transcriptional regulator [Cereibacter sphaeroides]
MDMLIAMKVMTEVARTGSFVGASRSLSLSPASISRIVGELEAELQARLVNRTTRQLKLTEAGEAFVARAPGILEEVEALRYAVADHHAVPRGRLRISCVAGFGNECLAPALPAFLARHPGLQVTLDVDNRKIDLLEDHYDVAIRLGPLPASSLIAQRIATQRVVFVATPGFVARHGRPERISDLAGLPSIMQVSGDWGKLHRFRYGGEVVDFAAPQEFVVGSAAAARNAVLTGHGYGLLNDFAVERDLAEGRLVRLLEHYEPEERPILAIRSHRVHVPQKILTFLDFLRVTFRP